MAYLRSPGRKKKSGKKLLTLILIIANVCLLYVYDQMRVDRDLGNMKKILEEVREVAATYPDKYEIKILGNQVRITQQSSGAVIFDHIFPTLTDASFEAPEQQDAFIFAGSRKKGQHVQTAGGAITFHSWLGQARSLRLNSSGNVTAAPSRIFFWQ